MRNLQKQVRIITWVSSLRSARSARILFRIYIRITNINSKIVFKFLYTLKCERMRDLQEQVR